MTAACWVGLATALIAPVPISFVVEALRKKPRPPERLSWDGSIPIAYSVIGGVRIRYIRTGMGPPLLLLHSLRTQLDIFQKVIPRLAQSFTVWALDFPGHGWSDIPKTDYTPDFFARAVAGFLDTMGPERVLVAGISIGATIPLLLAAEGNPRVRAVVSINPFDYGERGADRANLVAKAMFTLAAIPVLGETVMRFRNRTIEGKILEGGVATPAALPPSFLEEVFVVGERAGHYRAFVNLIRHMPLWRQAHEVYGRIKVPVLLVYGDLDWSREAERQHTQSEVPGARREMVPSGGHFLSLDQPEAVVRLVTEFGRDQGILPATD